ncbi:DNA recombination protein RmuC [Flavobacteriales bacterium]|nr:DNA recombination protein RmuC [Flavobacteriales bacterium]
METLIIVLLIILLSVVIFFNTRKKNDNQTTSFNTEEERNKIINLEKKIVAKEEEIKYLKIKIEELKKHYDDNEVHLTASFKNLANKILEDNSEKFKKQNSEQLGSLLNPLGKEIENFKKKVEETNKDYIDRNAALTQKIQSLESLNLRLSQDAVNLTNALKGDSKVQGDWGEIQLEVLLEKSGLTNGIHFKTQGGYKDDEGNLKKPDFIINLPDNKHLIIDAKVSLTAYESYFNSQNDLEKSLALKKHIDSIKKHFTELSNKDYPSLYGINAPDHVLMFVPIEPALMLALHEHKGIYLDALEKNIVLISSSTLLATLSTIASIWKQEDQKKNVLEIAKEGGLLYDKFEGFVSDLLNVGKTLKSSQASYEEAMNKLVVGRGNIIKKVENLKKLGAKTKKTLPSKLLDRAETTEM